MIRMSLQPPGRTGRGALLALALLTTGCASWGSTEKGAAGGAAAGAVLGGVIGKQAGSTSKGAILGAVLGGAAGAAIGAWMDRQAEDLQDQLPGARVERVGEGIEVTFASGILFNVDSDALRATSQSNLQALAASLEDYDGTEILVVGHTDATGSDGHNQGLSERRAMAARTFLLRQGVDADRVEAVGRGESEPLSDNATPDGRQRNRRVEIAIFASEELRNEMLRRHGR